MPLSHDPPSLPIAITKQPRAMRPDALTRWGRPYYGKLPAATFKAEPTTRTRPRLRREQKGTERVLPGVRGNAGIEAAYRRKLYALIDEMQRSFEHWLKAGYRANQPVLAQDATPAADLDRLITALSKQWEKRFNDMAPKLAKWFAQSAAKRSSETLRRILRNGGLSVKFKMTKRMQDVMTATIAEQVGLIKSIPKQYHTEVQGMVMRSVQTGRDLSGLSQELRKRYGITKRKAALIARDQNNKATASITRVRQLDLGIKKAMWLHSHGGKEPRPTHLKNDAKPYDIAKGWFDPDPRVKRRIFPGELINCRCVSGAIIEGFS